MNRTSYARDSRHWPDAFFKYEWSWPGLGLVALLSLVLMCLSMDLRAQISISHLGTYTTGSYNTSAAEIVSFDPVSDRIFFVNAQLNEVRALNASNPASLSLAFTIPMAAYGGGANSVAVVPGGIAVAVQANTSTDSGSVVFFDANGVFLSQVTVGALPDHVCVTPNGQKVLVANEGEPNTAYTIDPQGTISVIDISGGIASVTAANVTTIDFTAYTPAMLPGVRIFGPGASVAQDMEPEYIAASDDSQKAFVTCQENNAVVRIDLVTNTIEQITALGLKDHSLPGNGLDASDSPTGINIANWPIKGLYMPDAADAFTIAGQTYVAYANEGDAREYGTAIVEPRRIGNAAYVLDPAVFPNAATLKLNANLGRLNASTSSGNLDADPEFEEIHVFGSRSFTIRDVNGAIVWDSGDQFEQITSMQLAANFNCNNSANGTFDTRSDDKGPEPEAIVVADVYGSTYAFIGLERIGGIMVYDVSVPSAPVFVQYLNNRNFVGNAAAGTALDLGPEDIKFVSATDSPDGMPFLIVGNEISGTVSLFRVNPPPYKLQILHASDFEAAVPATDDAPRFAAIVDSLEHTYANSLTLSSGDNFLPGPFMSAGEDPSLVAPLKAAYETLYGGPFANNDLRAGIGRVDITILNILGVQAAALGNHEFDLGTSELRNIIAGVNSGAAIRWFGAQFPYLSSNLNFSGDANLSNLFTATREQHTFFKSNPSMTAATIAATKKLAPSTIINVNGEEIGVVGATTQILASISSPGATTIIGPSSDDMPALAAILQPVIDSLIIAEGIDKIILLSHLQQLTLEKQLALLLNGVDVIIAGGSHTLMADATDRMRIGDVAAETYPYLTTGLDGKPIAIVNTTSEYKYVGRLVVDFDANGEIIPASIDPLISGAYPADSLGVVEVWGDYASAFTLGSKGQEVKNLCDAVKNVIIAKDGNLFGKTSVFLEGRRNFVRTEETNLGNVSADANRYIARRYDPTVQISIKNGGGIRSAIGYVNAVGGNVSLEPPQANPLAGKAQGDISQLDIENSLRFNNLLSTLTLTAANLRTILEHGVAASGPGQTQGRFPQISGVRFSYNETLPAGARILNAVICDSAGVTLDTLVQNGSLYGVASRTFRVVTLNFLAGGGDGYPFNTLGTARVDLNTLADAGPGVASFAIPGSEQDAFAEYMKSFHAVAPYALAETPASADERIQEVNDRPDCILPPRFYADSDGDNFGDPNDFITSCPGGAPTGYVADSTDDCPTLFGKVDDSCDDGDANTVLDAIDASCACAGAECTADLELDFQLDGTSTITWELFEQGTNVLIQNSTAFLSASGNLTQATCLPDGCFYLVVTDDVGDGITGGGYVLRTIAPERRVIDNRNNFLGGATSQIAGNQGFCLPFGNDRLISASCDRLQLQRGPSANCSDKLTADNTPNGTSGNVYQFQVFDPNGDEVPVLVPATGAGSNILSMNQLPTLTVGKLYNIRVRTRISPGVYRPWGPVCRMSIGVSGSACRTTQLMDDNTSSNWSCGKTITLPIGGNGGANRVTAVPVTRFNANCVSVAANKYQFRFRDVDSNTITIVNGVGVNPYCYMTAPAFQNCRTYEVDVRASFNNGGIWCDYGAVCEVFTSGCVINLNAVAAQSAELSMFPNPNRGDQLYLVAENIAAGVNTVSVDIYDTFGKRVSARTIAVADGFLNTVLDLNGEFGSGIYTVSITAGDQLFTERLVIHK